MKMLVILLNWNNYNDSRDCLESILPQCPGLADIMLLDNASTDGSFEQLRAEYVHRVIFQQNGKNAGFAAGNNPGLEYALKRGYDCAVLLNNDTVIAEKALERLRDYAACHPRMGVIGVSLLDMAAPHHIQALGGGWITSLGVARHITKPVDLPKLTYVTGAAMYIRTQVIEDIGMMDEQYFMYWEDVDYSYRAVAAGWDLGVCTECCVYHQESSSAGLRSARQIRMKNRAGWIFARKHYGLSGTRFLVGMALRDIKARLYRRRA